VLRTLVVLTILTGTAHADDDELDPVSSYTIDGERDLHVEVTYQRLTGSSHYATHLDLHTATAKLLREPQGFEDSPTLPLVDKVIAVDPHRWVVIGWSSYGEGMQTMTAWIVIETKHKLRVTDEVYWTSDRSHAGFVIEDANGKLRLGIPELPASKGDGDMNAPHNPGGWELQIGKKKIDLAKLSFTTTAARIYQPPFDDLRDATGPFAWITANGEHFTTK
jgi:hypothetical protein